MAAPTPFVPGPQIPAGLSPSDWKKAIKTVERHGSEAVLHFLTSPGTGVPGPGSGFGAASQYRSYAALLNALYGVNADAAQASAYLMTEDVLPLLRESVQSASLQSNGLAAANHASFNDWLTANAYAAVPDTGAFAAAVARGNASMLHDWSRLTTATQQGVAEAIQAGLGLGLHPTEVASYVQNALNATMTSTYSRGLLIARTEMADLQASARLADMRASGVIPKWEWKARPDACPVCQILHAMIFDTADGMDQHHQCRCTMLPVVEGSPEAAVPAGEYVPGKQRSWDQILDPPGGQRGIPQSWRGSLPDDPRALLGKQTNNGWRDSWGLSKPGPGGGLPAVPAPPPPALGDVVSMSLSDQVSNAVGYEQQTGKWPKNTPKEVRALADYQGTEYLNVNEALRAGGQSWATGPDQLTIRQVTRAIDYAPRTNQSVTAYRGLTFTSDDATRAFLSQAGEGAVFTDPAFASTSLSRTTAASFGRNGILMEIDVPAGSKAVGLDLWGESELLLQRGTSFRVTRRYVDADGTTVIQVTAVQG